MKSVIFVRSSKNCSHYHSDGFRCVPYYRCNDGKVVTDGDGRSDLISNQITLDPNASKCQGDLEICCQLPKFLKVFSNQTQSLNDTSQANKVVNNTKPLSPKVNRVSYKPKCGQRNVAGYPARIIHLVKSWALQN